MGVPQVSGVAKEQNDDSGICALNPPSEYPGHPSLAGGGALYGVKIELRGAALAVYK